MQHFRGWLQVNRSSLSFLSSFFSSFFCFSFLSFSLSISGSPLDLFFPSLVLCVAYSFPFFIIMFLRYQTNTNTVGLCDTARDRERERVDKVVSHKFVITAITKANCQNGEWPDILLFAEMEKFFTTFDLTTNIKISKHELNPLNFLSFLKLNCQFCIRACVHCKCSVFVRLCFRWLNIYTFSRISFHSFFLSLLSCHILFYVANFIGYSLPFYTFRKRFPLITQCTVHSIYKQVLNSSTAFAKLLQIYWIHFARFNEKVSHFVTVLRVDRVENTANE